jgi:hypothetical protein
MVRFLARTVGLLLMAAGFVGLVIDATRFIANGTVTFTPVGKFAATLSPEILRTLEPAVTQHVHRFLWDPILLGLFQLPAPVVGFAVGALLLWLGQKPAEPIGYLAGS